MNNRLRNTMADPRNITSSSQLTIDTSGEPQQRTNATTSIHGKPDPPSAMEQIACNNNNNNNTSPLGRRIRSTRSKSAPSPSSASSSGNRVLFSTPSKYDRWTTVLLSIPLVVIFVDMISLWIANATISSFERSASVWISGWALIFVGIIYMLVLPKQVDIRSNGTIGIKTFLVTYQFGDICHVYPAAFGRETMMGARYRFATCFRSQMVIRRRSGKCDVVISPLQAEEFLQTLQSVITRLEIEAGRTSTDIISKDDTETGATNPPLRSCHDPPVMSMV